MNANIIKTEDLGYDDFFESNRKKLKLDSFSVARVTAEHKGIYKVKNANGEYSAKITGKQIHNAQSREDYPVVGDWVAITELSKEQAVIQGILPRKTIIKRRYGNKDKTGENNEIQIIATNIDVAFIVESVDRDYNLNRIERYFAIVKDGGAKPTVVLNKIDLISKEDLELKIAQLKDRFCGSDIITTSATANENLNDFKKQLFYAKTYCFLGSSGVGKSSLINKLIGKGSDIKTGTISEYSGRGKHITTSRQMYFLDNGSIVIDNPGIREVGMTNSDAGIDNLFDEITVLAERCKYNDCRHTNEPGCAVLFALQSGKLSTEKYSNYINLKKEVKHYEMTNREKREKDRQFGKFVKNVKKQLKKYDY